MSRPMFPKTRFKYLLENKDWPHWPLDDYFRKVCLLIMLFSSRALPSPQKDNQLINPKQSDVLANLSVCFMQVETSFNPYSNFYITFFCTFFYIFLYFFIIIYCGIHSCNVLQFKIVSN